MRGRRDPLGPLCSATPKTVEGLESQLRARAWIAPKHAWIRTKRIVPTEAWIRTSGSGLGIEFELSFKLQHGKG